MKKFISICFLWAFTLALWGQNNGGYGGDFNPSNPPNPQEPSAVMKYDLKLTANKGGSVYTSPSGTQFVAGANVYLRANANSGYRFRCWMQNDTVISTSSWFYFTMPAKDTEVKALFSFDPDVPANPEVMPLIYNVTVEATRGGSAYCSNNNVKVGEYTYVRASSNSGYKFVGWMLDGNLVSNDTYYYFEMEKRDMHFVAMFEFDPTVPGNPSNNPNGEATYQVQYMIDGEMCYTEQLPAGAVITAIAFPTKRGYTFSGWGELPSVMPANDIVISGTFTVNKYHIIYKVDGDILGEADVDYGTRPEPPAGEEVEGHTLTWKNLPSEMPDEDIVVEGFYSPNVYKLVYVIDGDVYKSVDVTYADSITVEADPVREGHTFSGWSEAPATMPAKDVVISGSFAVNYYKVTYVVDGKVYAIGSIAYGTEIPLVAAPVRKGYTFSGWNGVPEIMPAEDITIEGSFAVNYYMVTYMVDGEVYATDSIAFGEEIVLIDTPVREGYTFSGWGAVPTTMPAEDVVVTGSFTVNYYAVTYMVDGEVYATDSIAYGDEINLIENPYREGYTFSGWSEVPAAMPAEDVVVEGSFAVNYYTVTYIVDGEVYATDSIAYGDEINLIKNPYREGYTFSGWSEVPATMPAEDIVVYGTFEKTDTGIDDLEEEKGSKVIYDLAGRRVTDMTEKGIYIIDGKKIIVR